ncbi:putative neutral protease 2 protein [Neofusicoccum parvum UCRNP2]|uniref:Neutral protease 2 n=1 Tax=Botryosphaeria parva (strain UCR-NP2) TaxID=1287680 RepID=R1GK70_BOTPV|nr:putative neutral protease 2 protein [Neofusicoccum parvum UCRNP2]
MKFFLQFCVAALVAVAACSRIASLDVSLTSTGNTLIQAVLTNTGNIDLNLLNKGTILGDAPVKKVYIFDQNNTAPQFDGVRFNIVTTGNFSADYFTHVKVGQSTTTVFDVAEEYDLSAGGKFTAVAVDTILYAEGESTFLNNTVVPYNSNVVEIDVDGAEAAKIQTVGRKLSSMQKRLVIKDSCDGDLGNKMDAAVDGKGGCTEQAKVAAEAAENGEKLKKYFEKNDEDTKKTVAARLRKVSAECDSENEPIAIYCEDVWGWCYDHVNMWSAAYTLNQDNLISICPGSFNMPSVTEKCHEVDLTGILIHELTHLDRVYNPATDDFAAEWPAAAQLNNMQALMNGDTYRLYAQDIYLKCPGDDVQPPTSTSTSTTTETSKPTAPS